MKKDSVGTVYLADDGEPLAIPSQPAFDLLPSGWITVVRNGTTLLYPPGRIDHVEIASQNGDEFAQ